MFRALDQKDKNTILDCVDIKSFGKGSTIIKEGDDGQELYILGEGKAKCFKKFDGQDRFLRDYDPGDVFGELALLYNAPRAATITAEEDCRLFSLSREAFNCTVRQSAIKKRKLYEDFLNNIRLLSSLDEYEKNKICDCLQQETYTKG